MSKERICFALDLKNDPELIAEYEAYHQHVWSEVIESIKAEGIHLMDIYKTGNRLFMITEVDHSFKKEAIHPKKVQEWEELMDTFQQRLPWANEGVKWVKMDKIFEL